MTDPLHDLFEPLEPPPGGLVELRRRIRGERAPRRAWLGGLALAGAAVAVLLALPARSPEPGAALAEQLACADPTLASVLCARHEPGVTVSRGHMDRLALSALTSGDERVLIYRVASIGTPLAAEQIPEVELDSRPR